MVGVVELKYVSCVFTDRYVPVFRFDIVKKLGQGTYGKVQLAINKETGQDVSCHAQRQVFLFPPVSVTLRGMFPDTDDTK